MPIPQWTAVEHLPMGISSGLEGGALFLLEKSINVYPADCICFIKNRRHNMQVNFLDNSIDFLLSNKIALSFILSGVSCLRSMDR